MASNVCLYPIKNNQTLDTNPQSKKKISILKLNNNVYSTDYDKAKIFGEFMKVFSEEFNPNFNNENKIYVENYTIKEGSNLFSTKLGDENYNLPFSILELEYTKKNWIDS